MFSVYVYIAKIYIAAYMILGLHIHTITESNAREMEEILINFRLIYR